MLEAKTFLKVCKDAGIECICKISLIRFLKKKYLTFRKEVINFNGLIIIIYDLNYVGDLLENINNDKMNIY